MRLGVIGLGNIGGAVAANLVADGHGVAVADLDAARVAALVAKGARAVDSAAALARESEITLASLPTPEAVDAVAADWLSGAAPGSVFVDLSTNSPDAVRALGARLAARGCHLLEAPLTGGAQGARARGLVFLVGGEAEVLARCAPVLAKLGRASFHMGPLGCGNVAKLVNSLLAFTATWVSLEGLSLAAAGGVDLRTMVDAVRTGGAGNFFIDRMVEGIGQRGRPPHFALGLAAKDARLIVDTALRLGVPTPVAGQIAQVFAAAARGGLADHDWSDLVEWAERQAGLALVLRPAEPKPPA
jgi:3-hydroxyisobutyrate dehydrogenase-like beta-hydroxyacid dehydrogenase